MPPLSDIDRHTSSRQDSQALISHPVTSMKKSSVPALTVVWLPLIIGGNERTISSESRITGKRSIPSIRWEYSAPFGCSSRIRSIVISSEQASGMKEKFDGTVVALNGGFREFRSWTPIDANFLLLPNVMCNFS